MFSHKEDFDMDENEAFPGDELDSSLGEITSTMKLFRLSLQSLLLFSLLFGNDCGIPHEHTRKRCTEAPGPRPVRHSPYT